MARIVVGITVALASGPGACANILFYDTFKTQAYTQNSASPPVTPVGYFASAAVIASLAGDLTGGTVTSTSPLSPMVLTGSAGDFTFQTSFLAAKAALDADFPNNTTYTFNLSGGTYNGQSATLVTPAADAYSASVPFFTGSTYTTLQNFNVANSINLLFNSWSTPAGVNTPLTFIGISKVSDGSSAFNTSGANTLTSALVAANTLLPGTQYDLDIVYSARLETNNAGFGSATSFAAYDLRTDLVFTTAPLATTPEPSSLGLAALGAFAVALGAIHKRGAAPHAQTSR